MQHFSEDVIEKAKRVNLVEYLQSIGEPLKKDGKEYRLKKHDSLSMNPETNLWFWYSRRTGGKNAIDYLMKVENMRFTDAVEALTRSGMMNSAAVIHPEARQEKKIQKPFALPPPAENNRRVFAYLSKERRIPPQIINHFIKVGALYEDAEHHNAVFVGRDEKGVPRYAMKRSTNTLIPELDENGDKRNNRWDVEGSEKQYSYGHVGTSNKLYIFEAPIDALSHISLRELGVIKKEVEWKKDSYIWTSGLNDLALAKFLELYSFVDTLIFCWDNDINGRRKDGTPANWGQLAETAYMEKYQKLNYQTFREIPQCGKDFNEMLKRSII